MSYKISESNLKNIYENIKTDTTEQAFTDTDQSETIQGSEVTYTPHADATNVIYEFNFMMNYNNKAVNWVWIQLYEDTGSGYQAKGTGYVTSYYSSSTRQPDEMLYISFILDSWTGSRSYKLVATSYSSSTGFRFHRNNSGDIFYPTLKIFSVT
ncbi:hypothetical protein CL614_05705 [archaeon]|nr:hypothetical protein [archaeon]